MAGVKLDKITKVYPNGFQAVSGLSLELEDGEFMVLVGPSGCGKSTALRMIAGLEEISSGDLFVGDRRVNDVAPKDRDIAMVFQNYALYPQMSVRENIGFPLRLKKLPKQDRLDQVDGAARILELMKQLDKKPATLSGGQRQRVAMGRAIVRRPSAFLMDEPLSNLDAKLRVQMRAEIASIQRDLGVTTFYVTHDQVEAMTMADKIVVLRAGVIEQVGSPLDLYRAPLNKFVASFIGSPKMNQIEGPEAAKYGASTIGIRPEHVTVSKTEGMWSGKVGVAEHLGSDTFIHVYDTGLMDMMTVRITGDIEVFQGDTIYLTPDIEKMHKFDLQGLRQT